MGYLFDQHNHNIGIIIERMENDDLFLTYRGVVYPWHCDQMGHMNVMWYVGKFDEATWQTFHQMGLTADYLRVQQRGMAAVRQEISYRRELLAGDLITIYTGVIEISQRSMRFYHEMRNDASGEIAATTLIKGVHMDLRERKAVPFPPEFVARAEELLTRYKPVL